MCRINLKVLIIYFSSVPALHKLVYAVFEVVLHKFLLMRTCYAVKDEFLFLLFRYFVVVLVSLLNGPFRLLL